MQIPVLIEPVAGNGYRAKVGGPFSMTVEGATRDETLRKVHEQINQRLKNGTEIVQIEVPEATLAGFLDPHDPLVKEWEEEVAAYRKERDKELEKL